jgi:hypothetical protein
VRNVRKHDSISFQFSISIFLSRINLFGVDGFGVDCGGAIRTAISYRFAERADTKARRQDIIVSADSGNVFGDIPPYFYDTVLMSCAGRLDDARGVRVDVVSKRTNRSDAINNAKSQKEAYVVWLQLRTDGVDSSIPNGDLSTIRIEYIVYEPTTGKVKTQGTCYQGSYRTGGVILAPRTSGSNNPTIAESRLKDSAREAAERILKALSIASPSDIPQH